MSHSILQLNIESFDATVKQGVAGSEREPREEFVARRPAVPGLSLVLYPDQVLRQVCQSVETFDSALRDLADEMLLLMRLHSGIGLAALQVGVHQRLIVSRVADCPLVLTNLEVQDSTEPRDFVEGCLRLPGVQVNVRRPERIRVTGFTMEEEFYRGRLAGQFGLEVVIPDAKDRETVHRIIYEELCVGSIRPESKAQVASVMRRLVEMGAEGIILGCTELGLLIGAADCRVPLFDTTRMHALAAVKLALNS